jgi:uncharacterized phage protein gp47/JayE
MMATYKSFNEIVSTMIEQLRLVQPNLDTKPGTVSRDLFIDLPADQLEKLYRLISLVSDKQSPDTAIGSDLDRYASNYGLVRNVGSSATGIVVFTTNTIITDIPIPAGSIVSSKSGVNFKTVGNYFFSSSDRGRYAATAQRIKRALQQAGISDKYAIEVPIQATRPGTSGNLSNYQLTSHNLDFEMKVINLSSTGGGSNIESDAQFKARISSIFSGANTGTAQGYRNAVLAINGINDALVVEPGNSLMLRDGTEIIEINDGTKRIISSGTGGKVDLYVLGRQLVEVSDSFVFTDSSGVGKINDERNDYILGQGDLDKTLTSEERRLASLSSGSLPLQPVSNLVSVAGSSSGVLFPKTVSSSGVISGNYELVKDINQDTGGSPFGFDRIHFISGVKSVNGESLQKLSFNSISSLNYTDIKEITSVYSDIQVLSENSSVSVADKSIIKTLHYPITSVSTIQNKTTGEYYTIESQNIDPESGLNSTGTIKISGKNLPNQSDILSVSYYWRKYFDKYVDYNGNSFRSKLINTQSTDSINWGYSNFIREEESTIQRSDDGNSYIVNLSYGISQVSSVFIQEIESSTVQSTTVGGSTKLAVVLSEATLINNINRITNTSGMEIYNTSAADGYFSGLTIILPSDASIGVGESVIVYFNKVELYNIDNTDASFYESTIVLPSDSILDSSGLTDSVFDIYSSESPVFCSYVGNLETVMTKYSLSSAPFFGSEDNTALSDSSLLTIDPSYQPIIFKLDATSNKIDYVKYTPTNLILDLSDATKPGKIKISGTTLTRSSFSITYGIDASGLTFDLSSYIKTLFDKNSLDSSYYIARIDEVYLTNDAGENISSFDILGYEILNNQYDIRVSKINSLLTNTKFTLPATNNNLNISLSSGSKIIINLLVAKENDAEEIYYSTNGRAYSAKSYAFISKISVSSGFRGTAGNIIGNLVAYVGNQPLANTIYYSNYSFLAPKEGERITIRYNINRLILDATNSIESVRPISADVLVKEASEILVDVSGQVLINELQSQNTEFITQNAADEISRVLSTNTLGSTVDYSDIISAVSRVSGVDSINISLFNVSGSTGRKSFIKALDNQTINPGNIFLEAVARKDFKIS